ncbi:DNA (cytosine-5)-methyltransferase 1 [Dyadobacter sp. BE34]|uniref:DNA (cytosine-5-)-methyltransferase n=1 Tax=Dyadobacter fermentans TaxID=94254 RepID=A0ABU1R292_9BACT|nr:MULTISPECIES: DNA cytosine methyltransferase [Dyadobacter]MDR6807522.1 DNA (cytosine-5)-methyltransferase 1 [Dyadobacter fermentans]MDR7045263.1 DNA (cytosine-5)-methyltransferase 1 [Dyadobacter sp. BE242]MDR7199576.1 DNA (cytosine-5)-methyltransferase 1 [Dyadobacter sp. BE34]MDR7217965.1 DNA (cytosine-5)-methyltransferase 1 [Dyadobacter sp. BE31]MDR7265467.1 DNA (cytosine-5)-methyltransferase 1 [Dyadobacter sp. BE32]
MKLISIDLFSGVGGLTEGLHQAKFSTKIAFELDKLAAAAYTLNHKKTEVINDDIRNISIDQIKRKLKGKTIHLLAGCPPCQGFSSIRRLNKPQPVEDERNTLINEYVRFVEGLRPYTFMMENVPGLALHSSFHEAKHFLESVLGYWVDFQVINVKDYGVPQSRKRLVLVGSRLGKIQVAPPTNERATVKSTIGDMELPEDSDDALHRIYPTHTQKISDLISSIPKNGGSRKDLGFDKQLRCHQKENIGFNDVYGRLRWDDYSTTITGGCLNPSKGRFLHPEQDRCISAREAALLQSFPKNYQFPTNAPVEKIALMIGNALPPTFSKIQAINIRKHIKQYLDR